MSNPYSAPSISGYNPSEPSNPNLTDTYTKKWANHKNDLGDPLKTYLAAISSALTTAFGLIPFRTFETKTADYTITTADAGKLIVQTSAATAAKVFTLPAAATAGAGFMVAVGCNITESFAVAEYVTVDGNSSETIDGLTSINIYEGGFAILICDGSSWRSIDSTPQSGKPPMVYTNENAFSVSDTTPVAIIDNIYLKASTWYRWRAFTVVQGGDGFGFVMALQGTGGTGGDFGQWHSIGGENFGLTLEASNGAESVSSDLSASYGDLVNYYQYGEGFFQTADDWSGPMSVKGSCRGTATTAATIVAKGCFVIFEEIAQ